LKRRHTVMTVQLNQADSASMSHSACLSIGPTVTWTVIFHPTHGVACDRVTPYLCKQCTDRSLHRSVGTSTKRCNCQNTDVSQLPKGRHSRYEYEPACSSPTCSTCNDSYRPQVLPSSASDCRCSTPCHRNRTGTAEGAAQPFPGYD